jgi:hypothetical protein
MRSPASSASKAVSRACSTPTCASTVSGDAAREAILAPIALHAASHADDAVTAEPVLVERVLDEVEVGRVALANAGAGMLDGTDAAGSAGGRQIEAPYLQLVLVRLWDEERRAGSRRLRLETLERLGGAERIVRTHLDVALAGLSTDEQEVAAALFRFLVTPSGTKIAHRVDDLAEYVGREPETVAHVLGRLAAGDTRVVKPAGDDAFEIYHDVLAAAVLDWRARNLHEVELAAVERRRRRRLRLALAALVVAFAAGVTAAIIVRRVQANRADKAEREAQAQALEVTPRCPLRQGDLHGPPCAAAERRVRAGRPPGGERGRRSLIRSSGRIVALPGDDGTIRLWDWRKDRVVRILPDRGGVVRKAAFSGDGRLLVSEADDGHVRVWDWSNERLLADLPTTPDNTVYSVAISSDGRYVAEGGQDARARVWDWRARRVLWSMRVEDQYSLEAVALSPDGKLVATATGNYNSWARVWAPPLPGCRR